MKKTFLAGALITSSLVLGISGAALAQQGVGNLPSPSGIVREPASGDLYQPGGVYAGQERGTATTGYSDRSERDVPAGWRAGRPAFVGEPAFDR